MATVEDRTVCIKGPAAPPPSIPKPQMIQFCHPHYQSPSDVLFTLPGLDAANSTSSSTTSLAGVHHRTALLACQIVANNAFRGFLATDREGCNRVTIGLEEVLTDDNYWFIADPDDLSANYPVVPRFEDWRFPLQGFRALQWRSPGIQAQAQPTPRAPNDPEMPPPHPNNDALSKTSRCVISNVSYLINSAHLIPKASEPWFNSNGMERFGNLRAGIHHSSNRVFMRQDLHTAWDRYMFALVPKRSEVVVHVLDLPSEHAVCEFAAQWHNTTVPQAALQDAADEYLFAKFAQAIFALLKPFITRGVSRLITRVKASDDGWNSLTEPMTGDVLKMQYGGGGTTRSASESGSRKRSHSQATPGDDDDDEGSTHVDRNIRRKVNDWDWEWVSDCEAGENTNLNQDSAENVDWKQDPPESERGRTLEQGMDHMLSSRRDQTNDTVPSLTTDNASLDIHEHHEEGCPQDSYTLPPISSAKTAGLEKGIGRHREVSYWTID